MTQRTMPWMDATKVHVKPFLKWAGGKSQLLPEIEKRLPTEMAAGKIETYVEPFIGGGAVFFYIAQKFPHLGRFCLIDINDDLINCYNAVKFNVDALIRELHDLQQQFLQSDQKEFFLDVRAKFNKHKPLSYDKEKPDIDTAARLLFLNRTCFNGLYRVNRKGQFNVPFGRYKNPRICAPRLLQEASELLEKAEIICGHFQDSTAFIDDKTFVYFDPPYRPLSATASFTSYAKEDFGEKDQIRLSQFCREIDEEGAKFLLSNSDPKNEAPNDTFFEDHYEKYGFHIDKVKAARAINCKAAGRGKINELLITNY